MRYEIDATVGGVRQAFSDDPSKGSLAGSGQSVEFLIQGASEGPNGQIDPTTATPWRRYVGSSLAPAGQQALADDGSTGFRWLILFNNSVPSTVHSVTIYIRI